MTINRPERRNSLNDNVIEGLNRFFDQAAADSAVSAIILTGAGGKAFCAGADLGGRFGVDQSFMDMHEDRSQYAQLLFRMNKIKKPILAAVEGYCLAGGMGLCLSSDVVIASEDSFFGVPEIKRGLWPYMVTAVLIRNLGRKKALELCMTGERITAAEAERIGMINYSVPKAEYPDKVAAMAAKLSSYSPAIMGLGKSSFYQIADMTLGDALEYLRSQLTINTQCEDLLEGVAAFMEKREPNWKGK
ncbi:MAG: enoyl-CoA hydratase/isomerase family protein [Proteobacteria bacterium]|nr:enoyl-CoA hydratase/isomerase family protein [Pseudomonadota bacterium]